MLVQAEARVRSEGILSRAWPPMASGRYLPWFPDRRHLMEKERTREGRKRTKERRERGRDGGQQKDERKEGERTGRRPAEAEMKRAGVQYGFVGTQGNLGAGGKEDTILTGAN